MSTEERRIAWQDRALYLRSLQDLLAAAQREQDAVQVGAQETIAFGYMLAEVIRAREVYRCQVIEAARPTSPTLTSPAPKAPPRPKRSSS